MSKIASRLRILVPDATTNYIQNPSVRFDTTGWTAFGSVISRVLDYARFGIASLEVITTGAVISEGTYYRVSNLVGVNEPITVSAYVRGTGRIRIRLADNPGGAEWSSKPVYLSTVRWKRIEVTGRCSGGNDIRLWVETLGNAAQLVTFYVDGAQLERHPYSTSYCDGDISGCRWNIIQSASMSTRDAYTREGGKWVELSGDEREQENLYMTTAGGLGMPPLVNNTQSFALAPGSYFQSTKVMDRVVTLTFHAKHKDLFNREKSVSLSYLHELRQFLIDTVKPDLTAGGQDFLLEYTDGDIPLYFRARYDGGLEGEWDIRNKWVNSFPLRLLLVSPMIYEDNQEIYSVDFQESFGVGNVCARIDGVWNRMNGGFNNSVIDLANGIKGEIYGGGSFTLANYNLPAVDPRIPANYISYWDGTQWQKMSTGANAAIHAICVAPNGYVYVTGLFTTIGGVAANYIAYWNGSTWNAMGAGLNGQGVTIAIAPNGDVYVGGVFTTAGGINAARIAKWDGSSWSAIGLYNGFRDGIVVAIYIIPNGTFMYVGGSFTDEFGIVTNSMLRVAKYTVSTNTFTQVGSGFNSDVNAMALSRSGVLYAGGAFTASGTTAVSRVAQFLGEAWTAMGGGMDGNVQSLTISPDDNDLIATGLFNTASDFPCRSIALWNGSSWVNLDIFLYPIAPTATIEEALFSRIGDIYVGGSFNASSISFFSGITYINNTGSAEVRPFIYISGSGTLRWLENQTTKKRIFLNLVVLSGEEVFIDFGKGTIESTIRGSLFSFILPGSDFSSFSLMPGENKIACFMTHDTGAIVKMGYVPIHWSMDQSS